MSINLCKLIDLPKVIDSRGILTIIESDYAVPFEIKRVYFLNDVPLGAQRGVHAHKELQQVIIAINGSFDVILDDGKNSKKVHLNKPYQGLYLCPMIWRELNNFSQGAVCLVLASNHYSKEDYYFNYAEFNKHCLK